MWPFKKKLPTISPYWYGTGNERWMVEKETKEYRLEQKYYEEVDMNTGDTRWLQCYSNYQRLVKK